MAHFLLSSLNSFSQKRTEGVLSNGKKGAFTVSFDIGNVVVSKILVIDEDKLIRWSLKEIFLKESIELDTAETFEEALKQLEIVFYNLIFFGLGLNDDSDFERLKRIRILQPETKIIVLSALAKNEIELLLDNLNIFSIIEKPFKSEQILSSAQEALDKTH